MADMDAESPDRSGVNPRWSPEYLARVDTSDELVIAVENTDGSLRRAVPIWVVRVDDDVFVRTWYHRTTGWFGHVLTSHRAHVRIAGMDSDVTIDEIGGEPAELRADIDGAYRTKYARYGSATADRMVSDSAASTTLRLRPRT